MENRSQLTERSEPVVRNQESLIKYYNDNYETRYGVELEICAKLEKEWSVPLHTLSFKDKFQIYFNNTLSKAPIEIRKMFNKIALKSFDSDTSTYYIYDLIELTCKELNMDDDAYDEIHSYKIPIFENDITVVCGDNTENTLNLSKNNTRNTNTGEKLEYNKSIGIECISPVFSFDGFPNYAKISESLMPYFKLLGLIDFKFTTNSTSGYHVNISMFDKRLLRIIPITKYPTMLFILNEYVKKEREYLRSEFRVKNSRWAHSINTLVKGYRNVYNANRSKLFNYIAKNIDWKKYALRIKKYEIIEFRVFQSEKKVDILISNVLYAITIVMNGILKQWENTNFLTDVINMHNIFPESHSGGKKNEPQKKHKTKGNINGFFTRKMHKSLHLRNSSSRTRKFNTSR